MAVFVPHSEHWFSNPAAHRSDWKFKLTGASVSPQDSDMIGVCGGPGVLLQSVDEPGVQKQGPRRC